MCILRKFHALFGCGGIVHASHVVMALSRTPHSRGNTTQALRISHTFLCIFKPHGKVSELLLCAIVHAAYVDLIVGTHTPGLHCAV